MPVINPWISSEASPTASLPTPAQSKSLVWSDDFTSIQSVRWTNGSSSAFPGNGPTNDGDNKLSYLNPAAVTNPKGRARITATYRDSGPYWNTSLLTTEFSSENFELLPGDYWETRARLPNKVGAWFSIWSWGRDDPPGGPPGPQPGHGEVDVLEYHTDNYSTMEMTNHVNPAFVYHVQPTLNWNDWITMGILFGTTTNIWYLNGTEVYSDGTGVPSYWRAWPILELAINNGVFHAQPQSTSDIIHCEFDWTRVYR